MTAWPCCLPTSACRTWTASNFCRRQCGFSRAKRALLTAYADTNAAISAINEANINYFFLKPWDPPTEHLYPQLDDLLDDWRASYRPAFQGIRVLGTRWSPRSHTSCETSWRATTCRTSGLMWSFPRMILRPSGFWKLLGPEAANLPVVLFPDGTKLLESVPAEVAQKVGLRTRAQTSFYDLAIVGGGPAGLAAAVYGASEGLHTVMIEREAPGRAGGHESRIENYLGFPTGLSGGDLARRAVVQAQRFGVEILSPQEAVSVPHGRALPNHQVGGRKRNLLPCANDCDRSAVAATGCSGHRQACRAPGFIMAAARPRPSPARAKSST